MGSLDGRVALITGAGRGIGRQEALFFASEGAKVVVNDPGVTAEGASGDPGVAQAVADEIRAAGGEAVASTDDVTDWAGARRMVETAVEAFGDLDVVVNNAAIQRRRALVNMTEDEFDAVLAVHLKGTFAVTRWAARHWRDQGDSRDRAVINTVSASGLLLPGITQGNYAAAKAGVAALTVAHAVELARYGVRVNAVSPSMARTRLTEGVPGMSAPTEGAFDPLDPALTAHVAAYLATPGCPVNGQVLAVRGTSVTALNGWSVGESVTKDGAPWTVAELGKAMAALPWRDPLEEAVAMVGGSLGDGNRDKLLAMVDAMLADPG
ncbi:SDR family NAD(P)-dependent oxidoreductase [Nonomuraea sp. MCN248]|uniref:SDR family NAD(P)-dependent oxidoreductase n=1 Tax=Nonomuraea corallina TaxID=2989783 RepID=A0ABT4SMF4_9ACTN|nr:SDR family NAD(P)-dependent oxidoreductase [Nonomuraea corallina]MDA0638120.1 SDR family NAD(P)-dependent oxidoreductase [Nonomuraea corallina]